MHRKSKIRGQKANQPSHFIGKLYNLMEDTKIETIICWTQAGDGINIKNVSRFSEEVLPAYFKHNNYSSFIRQLNMYGFKKVRHAEGENVYMNPLFQAGRPHQLKNISRKIREERDPLQFTKEIKQKRSVNKELSDLQDKQKNLESLCKHFIIQNQKLMDQNHRLIKRLETQSQQKDQRIEGCLLMLLANNYSREIAYQPHEQLSLSDTLTSPPHRNSSTLEDFSRILSHNQRYKQVRDMINAIMDRHQEVKVENFEEFVKTDDAQIMQERPVNDEEYLSIHNFQDVDSNAIKLQQPL